MLTTLLSINQINRDMELSLSRVGERVDIKRETEYYLEKIEDIKTPEELVADTRLFNYAMRAHGLEDMNYAKAFMLKVMKEGTSSQEAFANTLTDPRYRDFAETFDFATHGEATTIFTKTREGVVDRYVVQSLEAEAGQSDPGVRLALYFQRKAPEITSYFDILGDRALSQVVRTALQLPDAMAAIDIDRQAEMIAERLPLEDLQDPEKLESFIERFANLWQISQGSQFQVQPGSVASLLQPVTAATLSTDLLLQIQQLKP